MMWRLETVLFRRVGRLGSWHLKQLHSCLSKVLSVEIIPSQVKSNHTEFLFEQKIPLAYCAIDLLSYWLRTRKTLAKNEENPVEGKGNRKGKATRKHSNRLEFAWSIGQMAVDWQKSTNNQVEVIESHVEHDNAKESWKKQCDEKHTIDISKQENEWNLWIIGLAPNEYDNAQWVAFLKFSKYLRYRSRNLLFHGKKQESVEEDNEIRDLFPVV